MKLNTSNFAAILILIMTFQTVSCQQKNKANTTNTPVDKSYYENMKAGVMAENDANFNDSVSFFDENYIPTKELSQEQLIKMGNIFRLDSTMIVKFDVRSADELKGQRYEDTLVVGKEYYTRDLHDITEAELSNLRYNLNMVNNFKENPETDGGCSGQDCPVYAHVDKGNQRLYLFINGQPIDTFKTSTARKGYTTPNFDKKPDGRMFKRYTSHKYPHGDWNGLGNMPYAVFIQGGYAIHGATSGEIAELGHTASHGCIRINPKNAKIFYNLVKYAGAENTWVHITD